MDGVGVISGRLPAALELPRAQRVGLAVGSGLLSAAAFPPWDLGGVAFVALVPLFLALEGITPGHGAWLGYAAGLSFYLATIWWVVNTMTTYGRMPLALSLVALLLLCGVLAGYTAAFTWLVVAGRRRLRLSWGILPLAAAGLWTALEFLRTYLFSGFPWALLGYTQYQQTTIRLLASAVGVYGISALLILVNGTVAGLLIWSLYRRVGRAPGAGRSCPWTGVRRRPGHGRVRAGYLARSHRRHPDTHRVAAGQHRPVPEVGPELSDGNPGHL
jgi:apolipoprotein N-acyltransferase